MENWNSRTELLFGKEKVDNLLNANVLVLGLGGVGAYAAEQICRAGVGKMTIVDGDRVMPSNRNRQLIALTSTEGKSKADLMKKRLLDINPDLCLTAVNQYFTEEDFPDLLNQKFDYVLDAIDTLTPKSRLIYHSVQKKIPIVSSLGAGGKIDPEKVKIADISETYNCKLGRMLRKRLHRLGVYTGVKAVFSFEEINMEAVVLVDDERNKRTTVGTVSYMPAIFGNLCASVIIRDLISK